MKIWKLGLAGALLGTAGAARAAGQAPASFLVKVTGHGKPMILIPGLSCGGDLWNTTVAHYENQYECHVLTLPGFAGQPSIKAPVLQTVRDEIIAYIGQHHLDRPVLVGNSLGGTLALWIAAKAPNVVGKVVSVDGVPWFPGLHDPLAKMSDVTSQALQLRSLLQSMDQKEFESASKRSLSSMISGSREQAEILKTAILSDPKAVGEAMFEQYTTDLRPQMSKITAAVLMLGEQSGVAEPLQKNIAASYEDQIHTIPNHKFVMSPTAKPFIMLDDPNFFFQQVDAFLG